MFLIDVEMIDAEVWYSMKDKDRHSLVLGDTTQSYDPMTRPAKTWTTMATLSWPVPCDCCATLVISGCVDGEGDHIMLKLCRQLSARILS